MERSIEIFVIINGLVIGLSHALAPRAWARYFGWLRSKGDAGVFVVASTTLAFGSLVAAMHNVWHGWPLAVTLIGWAQVLKAALYFCFPALGLKQISRVTEDRPQLFVWPGIAWVLFSLFVAWQLWWR